MNFKKHHIKRLRASTNDVPLFSLEGIFTIGKVVNAYDGDTCKITMLFEESMYKFNCRLLGINAPEIISKDEETKKQAVRSRNRLIQLVSGEPLDLDSGPSKKELQKFMNRNQKLIYLKLGKFDKYGRLLVVLFEHQDKLDFKSSINQILIRENLAVPYSC